MLPTTGGTTVEMAQDGGEGSGSVPRRRGRSPTPSSDGDGATDSRLVVTEQPGEEAEAKPMLCSSTTAPEQGEAGSFNCLGVGATILGTNQCDHDDGY